VYLCIGEHITLHARDLTLGSPVGGVWFNLYNSNFYDPIYASRQLLLDTSAYGDPFSFADLFLHGPETLAEFQSYRPPITRRLVLILTSQGRCHAVDKQGSSWGTYGRGRQAWSVAWLLPSRKAHCRGDGSRTGDQGFGPPG
jgi:hypothetical protein